MPQMSSMDWLLLLIYFMFIFYLFMILVYFLFSNKVMSYNTLKIVNSGYIIKWY